MHLKGKSALITGASQGIGRELALALAAQGANVVVVGRNAENCDAVAAEIQTQGGSALSMPGSVAEPAFATTAVEACVKAFGTVDILINNAAVFELSRVDNCEITEWHRVLDTNLSGAFYFAREAVRHMQRNRWGRIINTTSAAALGHVGGCAYAASKGGLVSLTYAMARDYGMYGITANCFNPEAMSPMSSGSAKEFFADLMAYHLRRGFNDKARYDYSMTLGNEDGIAPWVTYLCLDEADCFNGRLFAVDGRRVGLIAVPEEERGIYRDYAKAGPWPLDELLTMAPLCFPVTNQWPKRSDVEIAALLPADVSSR